jgi:hypothetical protein
MRMHHSLWRPRRAAGVDLKRIFAGCSAAFVRHRSSRSIQESSRTHPGAAAPPHEKKWREVVKPDRAVSIVSCTTDEAQITATSPSLI